MEYYEIYSIYIMHVETENVSMFIWTQSSPECSALTLSVAKLAIESVM